MATAEQNNRKVSVTFGRKKGDVAIKRWSRPNTYTPWKSSGTATLHAPQRVTEDDLVLLALSVMAADWRRPIIGPGK